MTKHYQVKVEYYLSFQLVQLNKAGPELLHRTFPVICDGTENAVTKQCPFILLQVNTI